MNNAQAGGGSSEGGRGNMNNVQLDHNAIVQMLGCVRRSLSVVHAHA